MSVRGPVPAFAGALFLLAVAAAFGLLVGGVHLSLRELLAGDETARLVASLRAPRIVLAALVGASLALAGAALQALLKNPLADPFLLGTSGGAAVARRGGRLDLQRLLLAGLIANAFFSAVLLAVFSVASGQTARTMLFWMMGSLADATPGRVLALAPYAAAAFAVLAAYAARLNLFAVGEENAAALGVDVESAKRVVFLAASLATGAAVAFAGIIGFVGLLVPHAARSVVGNDQRVLLPVSAIGGAALLVAADAVSRSAFAPAELPVGAVTAAIGAPVFAWLLLKSS